MKLFAKILLIVLLPGTLYFLPGCRKEVIDNNWASYESHVLNKAGRIGFTEPVLGEFPTNRIYDSDSIYPIIQLENNLKVKRISDSLYLFDGDILFSEDNLSLLSRLDTCNKTVDRSATIITAFPSAYYWSNGIVPYRMDMSLSPAYRATISAAMSEISAHTPVSFVYANPVSDYNDYIVFRYSANTNSSFVGRQGGPQTIYIHDNNKGSVMHEIMHALGYFHEHSRSDRESYIIVDTSNILPPKRHNFDKYTVRHPGVDLREFDFNSIMLYSSYISDPTFVYNTSVPVMTRLDGSTWNAQLDSLSAGDIEGVWTVYGIPPRNLIHTVTNENTYSNNNTYYYSYIKHTTLAFYEDENHTIPKVLSHPARLNIIRARTNYNSVLNQLVTVEETITVVCPSGQASYSIDHRPNTIYIINNIPTVYDITEYYLP